MLQWRKNIKWEVNQYCIHELKHILQYHTDKTTTLMIVIDTREEIIQIFYVIPLPGCN